MITLEIVQRIWQMLEPPSSEKDKVEAHELDMVTAAQGHPLITVDAASRRHLLIPIAKDKKVAEDRQSTGVHIEANEWGDEGGHRRYVDVVCMKPHLNSLFDMVVFDILMSLPDDPINPDRVCQQVLNQWRELLIRETSKLPDKAALIGVFGELWMLRELTRRSAYAVNAWTGPLGGRFDFFTGSTALEVKSSTQRKGSTITVHGHDQLEPPPECELYLAVLKIEETPMKGENISGLAIQLAEDFGVERRKLFTLLANIHLPPDIIEQCNDLRLRIINSRFYVVNGDFPRIISTSFKGDTLPNSVLSLTYQLDLSTAPPHPLNEKQAELFLDRFAGETQ